MENEKVETNNVIKKLKKIDKWLKIIGITALCLMIIFTACTFIVHKEIELLKEKGYYNPVSVGDYYLNVSMFGNENGKHRIIGLAGNGVGEFSVTMRKVTKEFEDENLVAFVDRSGYGFSDDKCGDMSLERITEDYRKAVINAGIKAPYILMGHSMGGAYATYWESKYPEEVEAVIFVDGSQLSSDAFNEEEIYEVNARNEFLAFLAKLGFSRYVIRNYSYALPEIYSEEEQYLADGLTYLTLDSIDTEYENSNLAVNAQKAFNEIKTNDIPKLYISSSWGFTNEEEVIEHINWTIEQQKANNMELSKSPEELGDGVITNFLNSCEKTREEILYPYLEKLGNCEIKLLGGDHMIYMQKPHEVAELIIDFLNNL